MSNQLEKESSPSITVGIVVLNREWIIDKMLGSLLSQSYPHEKILVVVVDGGSEDKTVETAQGILGKADFGNYVIISRKCSIPEGRNICIEHSRGDFLLFWDSDVLMAPNAIQDLVRIIRQEDVHIVSANCVSVFVNNVQEVSSKAEEIQTEYAQPQSYDVIKVPAATMGQTIISREVLKFVHFDPDLTFREDIDFSVRAREKMFQIALARNVRAFDINIRRKGGSDIYIDMPLRRSLTGLKKKTRAEALAYSFTFSYRKTLKFFFEHKRYLFYLGYLPLLLITIYGLLTPSYLFLAFPVYLTSFALWQIRRRGLRQGIRATSRSIAVGVPVSLCLVYYFANYTLTKKKLT